MVKDLSKSKAGAKHGFWKKLMINHGIGTAGTVIGVPSLVRWDTMATPLWYTGPIVQRYGPMV